MFPYFILIDYLVRFNTNNKHFLIPNVNTSAQCLHQYYNLHISSRVLFSIGVRG